MNYMLISSFYVFFMLYLSSFLMVLSCSDWFMVWMGLEVNMISFIMMIYNKYNMNNIESCLKYFFIQSIGSVFILLMLYLNMNNNFYLSMILCYKVGGGIFYFWFPIMCENISWISCFLLMSMQKFIPFMLMSMFMNVWVWVMSLISLIIGILGSMNQINLKQLMAYSSIHHIGWMLVSFMINEILWMFYLLIYSLMIYFMMIYLNNKKVNMFIQLISMKDKFFILIMLLNMGGIPPMLGFFLKWWFFYYMVVLDKFMLIFMVMLSVMMLYIYFRLIYDFILGSMMMMKWNLKMMKLEKWIQMDMFMIFIMCVSSILGMLMIL